MADAYIGSETGALKGKQKDLILRLLKMQQILSGIDFSKNAFQNFNSIASLDRTQEISGMCRIPTSILPELKAGERSNQFADESVLCALINRQLKLFDPSTSSFSTLFTCEGGRGAIKGLETLER